MRDNGWPTVYLAGPIIEDPVCWFWRQDAERHLGHADINTLSPLADLDVGKVADHGFTAPGDPCRARGGFVARDLYQIRQADALLLYFVADPGRQSIGTWAELGYAVSLNKPIVVCSTLPNIIGHPFISRLATRIEPDLEAACDYLVFLLG